MRNLKRTLTTGILLCTFIAAQAAQTKIPFGHKASKNGDSVNVIKAQVHRTNTVGLGTQQPYEITTVGGSKESQSITLQYFVPPTINDFLVLKTGDLDTEDLMYLVYDTKGRVVKSNRIERDQTDVDLTSLPSDTYFLMVSNDQATKIFKIVKKVENMAAVTTK